MREYSGEYTVSDYVLANRTHLLSNRLIKVLWGIIIFITFLQVIVVATDPHHPLEWVLLLVNLTLVGYPYTVLPIVAKRAFAQQLQIHGQVKIGIRFDRITEVSATGSSTHLWLHHVLVSERMILLFTAPRTFIMLPRRFFKDDDDFDAVESCLNAFPTGINGIAAINRNLAPSGVCDEQGSVGLDGQPESERSMTPDTPLSFPIGPETPRAPSRFEKLLVAGVRILGVIAVSGLVLLLIFIMIAAIVGRCS